MAWRSSGRTNAELIGNLKSANIIKASTVESAMLAVDRADFCPDRAYQVPTNLNFTLLVKSMNSYFFLRILPRPLATVSPSLLPTCMPTPWTCSVTI